MHLNPESLSFALLISDLGSIARAANILGMKQATLSRKLTVLESRVGVRLFDRSTRGAVPTVSGAGFLNQARRIVADLDTLLTSSRGAASGEEGKLGIGFSTSLARGGHAGADPGAHPDPARRSTIWLRTRTSKAVSGAPPSSKSYAPRRSFPNPRSVAMKRDSIGAIKQAGAIACCLRSREQAPRHKQRDLDAPSRAVPR